MVKPLVPIIEYYANYEYIATVLCENKDKPYLECNGKCYLKKQLKEVNHDSHNHNSTVPKINFDDYPVSPLDQFTYNINEFEENYSNKFSDNKCTSQDYFYSLLKPPQKIF